MDKKEKKIKEKRMPGKALSFSCIIVMLILLGAGAIFGVEAAPSLAISLMYTVGVALYCGHSFAEIGSYLREKADDMAALTFIFAGIGFIIAAFVVSSTIPTVVYYAVAVVSPALCVPLAFILTSMTAFCIGTSFGTAGTVGICMISIGTALGVNPLIMAGAVISGSHVGLYISPLSDNFNTTMGLAGVDASSLLKREMYIAVPNYIMCVLFYVILGFMTGNNGGTVDTSELRNALADTFNVSPLAALPLVLVLILSFKKVPTIVSLVVSGTFAIILGAALNGFSYWECLTSTMYGVDIASILGVEEESLHPMIISLCNRGGMSGMMDLMCITSFGLGFAGVVMKIGVMDVIVNSLFSKAKSPIGLVLSTIVVAATGAFLTGASAILLLLPIQMLMSKWKENGYSELDCAAATNACNMIVAYVPWGGVPAYMASVTGVSTFAACPYTAWFWGLILWNIITAIFKIGYKKKNNSTPGTAEAVA